MYMNCLNEKKNLFLQWWLFIHGCNSLSLLVPCSESTASFHNHPHCTLPHSPSSCQFCITMHTDYINMPESSSVGHNKDVYEGYLYCTVGVIIRCRCILVHIFSLVQAILLGPVGFERGLFLDAVGKIAAS
jgi:hypothetical protein